MSNSVNHITRAYSQTERLLRLSKVKERTGLGRSSIYAKMKEGRFPQSISLGARAVGWLESEIDFWVRERIEKSRSGENSEW